MASGPGSGSGVEDSPAPGSEASLSDSETTSSVNVPVRRGPVLVSSDDESELERQPVRPLRAPSRTPSWAKSSISPSPGPVPIQRIEQFGRASESEAGSQDTRRRWREMSKSASRSVFSTGRSDSRGSDSAVSDSIASRGTSRWGSAFGSDFEHESDSGDSGRIRDGKAEWEMSPSRSLLSPSGSVVGGGDEGSGPGSDDDSGGEPELEVDLSAKQSSSEHGSIGNDEDLEPKTPSRYRSSSASGAEEALFASLDGNLEVPASPSGTDLSEPGTERWHSAVSGPEGSPEIGLSDEGSTSSLPAVQVSNSSQPRRIKIKDARRGKQIDKFNPKYVELLNEGIMASRGVNEFRTSTVSKGECHASGRYADKESWVLGSVWNMHERDMFFKHLSIVGKDNVSELARRIGTKSVVECRAYLKALQDGRRDDMDSPISQSSHGRYLISPKDIPAAVELTDECTEALEEEADALESRTLRDEERREKVKWGKFWLLESATSWTIESLYKNKDIEGIKRIAPEAELLNIYTMLELSESIFMNGCGDNNWQELSAEPPSIRYTAFVDIHTLVVSLTRRIVQTTLFMAMSRLRGMESKVFGQCKQIRPVDVEAAINCLCLPENSKEYWLRVPRRVGLHVFNRKEDIRKKSCVGFIPYDELERLLGGSQVMGGSFSGPSSQQAGAEEFVEAAMDSLIASAYMGPGLGEEAAEGPVDTGISNSDTDTDDGHDGHESIIDDVGRAYQGRFQKKRDARLKVFDDAEDLFMEAIDQKQNLEAEKALWKMMGKKPSKHLPIETGELPKIPLQERKRPSETLDWRDDVDYLASWETIKRRKMEQDVEERGEEEDATATSDIHSAEPLLELQTVIELQKREANPWKPTAKNRKQKMEAKKSPVSARSLRKPRARRQPKVYSEYVSAVENVFESGEEVLAREGQVDSSSSEVYGN